MLCCIGDLVEDIVVWPSAEPVPGTDTPARVFHRRGGSAATVAVFAVASRTPARFIGQVGDDSLGKLLTAELEATGVDVSVMRRGRTGSVVVLVDESGERTMLPDRAACTELSALPAGALDGVTWLHIPAYSLVVEPLGATARAAIAGARAAGAAASIDASSTGPLQAFGVKRFLGLVESLRPDVFLCNRDEAELLGIGAAAGLPGAALTVVKAGPDPVTLIARTGETTTVPVPPVGLVSDTTGAGDAFAAGFITASMRGASPAIAAEAAIRLAATVLTSPGAGR